MCLAIDAGSVTYLEFHSRVTDSVCWNMIEQGSDFLSPLSFISRSGFVRSPRYLISVACFIY